VSFLWPLLDAACVELELQARRKEEAIAEMVGLLVKAGKLADPAPLVEALLARERLMSTGIGESIAMPHALIGGLAETLMAFGRKREGLRFDALDKQPVKLLFLLAGPERQELAHLQLLSRLARLLRDASFKEALLSVQRPEEVVELFRLKEQEEP
jgi:PTS system fructose-specific IIC component